jgi:hypothetical protein
MSQPSRARKAIPAPPIALAAAASLARLTLATRAAHRCLAIRSALAIR